MWVEPVQMSVQRETLMVRMLQRELLWVGLEQRWVGLGQMSVPLALLWEQMSVLLWVGLEQMLVRLELGLKLHWRQ
jgi:hypothetical protein